MSKVLYRATKYMNAEDALLAREEKPNKYTETFFFFGLVSIDTRFCTYNLVLEDD